MGSYIKNIKIFLSVEKENGSLFSTFSTDKNQNHKNHHTKCKSFVDKKTRENESQTTINDNNGVLDNLSESLKILFSNDIPSKEIDGKELCEMNSSSEVKQQGKNY